MFGKNKVSWPHVSIMRGINRQRITYDQLSLTQLYQDFCKNILEQKSDQKKDTMDSYLGDLMEDASEFFWQVAHAVLLCKMEWGSVQWEDMDQIDRICGAHVQKHVLGRRDWAKPSDPKPWFCKNVQIGT